MKSTSTFRQFNESLYVRIPTTFAEYYNLKKRIKEAKHNGVGCSGHFDSFVRCVQCRYKDSFRECSTWRTEHQTVVYEVL